MSSFVESSEFVSTPMKRMSSTPRDSYQSSVGSYRGACTPRSLALDKFEFTPNTNTTGHLKDDVLKNTLDQQYQNPMELGLLGQHGIKSGDFNLVGNRSINSSTGTNSNNQSSNLDVIRVEQELGESSLLGDQLIRIGYYQTELIRMSNECDQLSGDIPQLISQQQKYQMEVESLTNRVRELSEMNAKYALRWRLVKPANDQLDGDITAQSGYNRYDHTILDEDLHPLVLGDIDILGLYGMEQKNNIKTDKMTVMTSKQTAQCRELHSLKAEYSNILQASEQEVSKITTEKQLAQSHSEVLEKILLQREEELRIAEQDKARIQAEQELLKKQQQEAMTSAAAKTKLSALPSTSQAVVDQPTVISSTPGQVAFPTGGYPTEMYQGGISSEDELSLIDSVLYHNKTLSVDTNSTPDSGFRQLLQEVYKLYSANATSKFVSKTLKLYSAIRSDELQMLNWMLGDTQVTPAVMLVVFLFNLCAMTNTKQQSKLTDFEKLSRQQLKKNQLLRNEEKRAADAMYSAVEAGKRVIQLQERVQKIETVIVRMQCVGGSLCEGKSVDQSVLDRELLGMESIAGNEKVDWISFDIVKDMLEHCIYQDLTHPKQGYTRYKAQNLEIHVLNKNSFILSFLDQGLDAEQPTVYYTEQITEQQEIVELVYFSKTNM